MSAKRLRRSGDRRRRRPGGFLWTLLGLLTLGVLTTILASRRPVFPEFPEDAEPEPRRGGGPDPEPEPEPAPATAAPSESLWIAGPDGNLYIRDGGEPGPAFPVLLLHSLAGNGGQWALQLDHLRRHRRAVALD